MSSIIFILCFAGVIGGALWKLYIAESLKLQVKKGNNWIYIAGVLFVGFIAHVICAVCYKGHSTDMSCFSGWSDRIFSNGLAAFYNDGGFHDYPPGYVYVMYVLGAVKHLFKMQDGPGYWLWLKLPAIIADLAMGWLVYRLASKKFGETLSSAFAAIVVLNPALIVNSASWGQIDSILSLFCVLSIYFTAERKFIPAFFSFAAGLLIKPQAAFFAPIIIFGLIDELFIRNSFDIKKAFRLFLWALAAVAAMFILFMPFGSNPVNGIAVIVDQYVKTLGEYNYMTINAFNVYAAAGNNWQGLLGEADAVTGVKKVLDGARMAYVFGYGMMLVTVAYSAYVFFKSKHPGRHYIAAFILVFGIYMFSVKMHERYAFPAIFMLIMALIALPSAKSYAMYGAVSLVQFLQMAWVLFIYNNDISKYYRTVTVINISLLTIAVFVMCLCFIHIEFLGAGAEHKEVLKEGKKNG